MSSNHVNVCGDNRGYYTLQPNNCENATFCDIVPVTLNPDGTVASTRAPISFRTSDTNISCSDAWPPAPRSYAPGADCPTQPLDIDGNGTVDGVFGVTYTTKDNRLIPSLYYQSNNGTRIAKSFDPTIYGIADRTSDGAGVFCSDAGVSSLGQPINGKVPVYLLSGSVMLASIQNGNITLQSAQTLEGALTLVLSPQVGETPKITICKPGTGFYTTGITTPSRGIPFTYTTGPDGELVVKTGKSVPFFSSLSDGDTPDCSDVGLKAD